MPEDIRINVTAETRQAQQAFTGLFQKFGEFAFYANNIVYWGKQVFGALEDVYKIARQGADIIGGEVAAAYDEFDENLKRAEESGKSFVANALLPIIESLNEQRDTQDKLKDALDAGAISQEQYNAATQQWTQIGVDYNKLSDETRKAIDANALAADEAAEALGRMNEAALALGNIAETEFDGGIGAGLSNINAALLTAEQRLDFVADGFRELGLVGPEAELVLINLQEAQGLLNADQADSERLMLALGIAIRDGLLVDFADLQAALIDGKLTQEEFAGLLGETGDAASNAGDDMDYLGDKIRLIPDYKKFTLEVDVIGDPIPDLDFSDPGTKGTSAEARASGGPVYPDVPYWVGEHGPEMFVPNSAGTIVPTGQAMGGNTTVNIYDQQAAALVLAEMEIRRNGRLSARMGV